MKKWFCWMLLSLGAVTFAGAADLSVSVPNSAESGEDSARYYGGSLDWSQGVLSVVRENNPDLPVTSWDAGTLECASTSASVTFRLRNTGPETISVSCPVLPVMNGFSRVSNCPCTSALAPGETSACTFTIYFNPVQDGVMRDTVRIQTNATNSSGGFVRMPLVGRRIATPASPQVVIQIVNDRVQLNWHRVTRSVLGCPESVPYYRVYQTSGATGYWRLMGSTADTSYMDTQSLSRDNNFVYKVVARTE